MSMLALGRVEFGNLPPTNVPLTNMSWPPTVSKSEYDALMIKYVALLERVAGAKL